VTRPLRDHRKQQDAQLAIVKKPAAMSAAAMVVVVMVVMSAVMAGVLVTVVVVAMATKSVFEFHVQPYLCVHFAVTI
jgi:hypothetical protein